MFSWTRKSILVEIPKSEGQHGELAEGGGNRSRAQGGLLWGFCATGLALPPLLSACPAQP